MSHTDVVEEKELASKLRGWFENSETQTIDARNNAERDRDYHDNKQLTDAELTELADRGQPPIIINRIKRKVDALLGIEKTQRTDPRAFPRNPADEDAAHAATDALRYVVDNNNYDQIRSEYWKNIIIEGIGIVKVGVKDGKRGVEITLKRIPWDRFFYDPHSSEPDFSDAKYLGEVMWMHFEDAIAKWPEKKELITTMVAATQSDTYDDKPKNLVAWLDKKTQRVRIIQTRWKDKDGWHITTSTQDGILKDDLSPFLDDEGEPESDLAAVAAFIDRDNDKYGAVREMISPQDEINKRRSKALHLMNVRQVRVDPDADINVETIRNELAIPDGVIEAREGDFDILPTGDMAASQFSLLQEAKDEIDSMGANPSLQGKAPQDLSGRAILAQQQAGLVELAPLLDRKRDLDIRVYRMIWNRVKQFWTEERWVRVTDDENKPKFIGLNRPMTVGMQLEKEFGRIPPEMVGAPELDLPAIEKGGQIIENNVGEMDMDIILDESPDMVSLQGEQFEQLIKLAGIVPIPPELYIEASSLRNKPRLLEMMSGDGDDVDPEQVAQEQAMQQRVRELTFAAEEANIRKTNADAADKEASVPERESKIVLNLANAQKSANVN